MLALLEANKGDFVSGQELADRLRITRSAVWKAVRQLRGDGYNIEAATNKGYRLAESSDIISAQSIMPFLRGAAKDYRLDIRKEVPSTNTELKKLAAGGEKAGLVLIANSQTAGRGRLGRSFYSPSDSGIYMSLLLRPACAANAAMLLTSLVAVSAAKALERITGIKIGIKWVNDLYCGDKKIAGILTEGGINMESSALEYAVVGIGINVFTPSFPNEIEAVATSLFPSDNTIRRPSRSEIAAEVLNQIAEDMPLLESRKHIAEYKARSVLIGKQIHVIKGGSRIPAKALDIDGEARLIVEYGDGSVGELLSDDVSIRF